MRPRWNTLSAPDERGRRFLQLLDGLGYGDASDRAGAAEAGAFIDEYLLPKLDGSAQNGWPDWAVLWRDRAWIIELKSEPGSHRPAQPATPKARSKKLTAKNKRLCEEMEILLEAVEALLLIADLHPRRPPRTSLTSRPSPTTPADRSQPFGTEHPLGRTTASPERACLRAASECPPSAPSAGTRRLCGRGYELQSHRVATRHDDGNAGARRPRTRQQQVLIT